MDQEKFNPFNTTQKMLNSINLTEFSTGNFLPESSFKKIQSEKFQENMTSVLIHYYPIYYWYIKITRIYRKSSPGYTFKCNEIELIL